MQFKAVIFDLDGTLLDTLEDIRTLGTSPSCKGCTFGLFDMKLEGKLEYGNTAAK